MTHPRTDVLVVGGTGVDTIVRVPDLAGPDRLTAAAAAGRPGTPDGGQPV
ncbi:hypothetical protein [Nocardiopsis sp. CC223A]|nr:hypothetical protein [Nocardiopsis sp. CC223A]